MRNIYVTLVENELEYTYDLVYEYIQKISLIAQYRESYSSFYSILDVSSTLKVLFLALY